MRILWVCNIMLPDIAVAIGEPSGNKEGWLSGIYGRLKQEKDDNTLAVCFPTSEAVLDKYNAPEIGVWYQKLEDDTEAYGFLENTSSPENYDMELEKRIKYIIDDFNPDIMHCFGVEFPHSYAAVKVFGHPDRTLVGIQGLCSALAEAYTIGLPEKVIHRKTFRDRIKKDNIEAQVEKFRKRGESEKACIRRTGHVTGRTVWDKEETQKINPNVIYHAMNETMRAVFYDNQEDGKPVPHSLFVSQGDYPIKGVHFVIEAMGILAKEYPDVTLTVAGNSIIRQQSLKDKLKLPSYGKYLLELIEKNGLDGHVVYTGMIDAEAMKQCYLANSIFVCSSTLENSSNAVGEASLLRVPIVLARVGGLPSLLRDEEAFFFEGGNAEALALAIQEVWEHPEEASLRAAKAYEHAMLLYDADSNYSKLMEIYQGLG